MPANHLALCGGGIPVSDSRESPMRTESPLEVASDMAESAALSLLCSEGHQGVLLVLFDGEVNSGNRDLLERGSHFIDILLGRIPNHRWARAPLSRLVPSETGPSELKADYSDDQSNEKVRSTLEGAGRTLRNVLENQSSVEQSEGDLLGVLELLSGALNVLQAEWYKIDRQYSASRSLKVY
jgi:hypothetical protein